jgi:hypothetical protein
VRHALHLQLAFALCAATLLLMMVPGFLMYRGLLRDLRERHLATWERLGRPTIVFYTSQDARRALHRFVSRREFEALGDAEFTVRVRRYQRYARLYSAVLMGLFVLFGAILALRFAR